MKNKKAPRPINPNLYSTLLAMLPPSVDVVDAFMEGKWLAVITDRGMKIKIKEHEKITDIS